MMCPTGHQHPVNTCIFPTMPTHFTDPDSSGVFFYDPHLSTSSTESLLHLNWELQAKFTTSLVPVPTWKGDIPRRRHEHFRLWIAALGKTGFNFKTLAHLGDAANTLQLSALWQGHQLTFGANLSLDIAAYKPADGVLHKQKLTCQFDRRINWPQSSTVFPSLCLWDVCWVNRALKVPLFRIRAQASNLLLLFLPRGNVTDWPEKLKIRGVCQHTFTGNIGKQH